MILNDQKYIWHPFTQHGIEKDTIPIVKSQDASLFTEDNFEIIDCISSWWTVTHGHNHPILNTALKEQIDHLSHVMFAGFTHPPAVALASKLIKATHNDFDKVFFADNGSGAIEVALKMAYQYHYNSGDPDKTIFLAFDGAYHGDTFGAMATGRTTGFYNPFEPFLCDVKFIPYPDIDDKVDEIEKKEAKALITLDQILEKHHHNIACMILEPLMQGAKGMRFCRPEFVKKLCQKLRDANILVIFDEVATGFGRTGSLFAYEQIGFIPDFICLSKGLTAGYMPLSVTMTSQKIFDNFLGTDYQKSFTHGHSFTANPLACRVSSASLDLFETDKTIEKIHNIHKIFKHLIPHLKKIQTIENIRLLGTVLAWDLKESDNGYKTYSSEKLKDAFLKNGLNIRPLGKTFYLLPPYCITEDQIMLIINKIKSIFLQN